MLKVTLIPGRPPRGRRNCNGMPGATIEYEPAESRTAMYGGNSNWRGPVWFPINYLVVRALLQYDQFFGPEFTIEYPTGSGQPLALRDIAGDIADRLISTWLPGADGRRPVYGGVELMQTDPAWKESLVLRVLPWRHRRRPRGHASDRLDGPGRRSVARPRPSSL
jgi:hypothetical protein